MYLTLAVLPSINERNEVVLKVQFNDEVLAFNEMHDRHWELVSVVPINALVHDWRGIAIFRWAGTA